MGEAWQSGAVLRVRKVPLSQVGCDETRRKIGGVYGKAIGVPDGYISASAPADHRGHSPGFEFPGQLHCVLIASGSVGCGRQLPCPEGPRRLEGEDILTGIGRTGEPIPNESEFSEFSEVVFSDAENLPLVASLCRWQRCKAVMPDSIGHPESRNL